MTKVYLKFFYPLCDKYQMLVESMDSFDDNATWSEELHLLAIDGAVQISRNVNEELTITYRPKKHSKKTTKISFDDAVVAEITIN